MAAHDPCRRADAGAAPRGTLLDGEGGDDVLGVDVHRIAPVARLLREPRPLRWRRFRSALGAVAPYGLRKRHVRKQYDGSWSLPWLRPAGRTALLDALSDYTAREPLSFSSSISAVPRYRMIELGCATARCWRDARA